MTASPCILQFGTSRFLQAHVDLFASEARAQGQDVPDIVIIQTTGDPARAHRLAAFADPAGFKVVVRGMDSGIAVDRIVPVRSVRAGLSATGDWSKLVSLCVDPAAYIVSNTGEAGYAVADADRRALAGRQVPAGFCGMLAALLHHRWQAGGAGITILPCELIVRNGDTLRRTVVDLAAEHTRDAAFITWLRDECVWANTLVDRIVSQPLEPVGAIAEPYALWAIERQPGLRLPFTHPAIVLTDDLEPYERLKLHILNLGHSWLADRWHRGDGTAGATVRAAMANPDTRRALERVLAEEVVPGFAAHNMAEDARRYVATTLERFDNPFLAHRLADIFAGHAAKLDKRVGGFLRWVDAAADPPPMPELRRLARLSDDRDYIQAPSCHGTNS